MELKGSNNWSDVDSSEEEDVRANKEAEQPERRTPLFDLGLIYSRQPEAEPVMQKQIFQERDRSTPETVQGVTLGAPELTGIPQPVMPPELMMAHEGIEDRDEDEEDEKSEEKGEQKSTVRPVRVPLAPGVPLSGKVKAPVNLERSTPPEEVSDREARQDSARPFTANVAPSAGEQEPYAVSFAQPAAEAYQAEDSPPAEFGPGNRNVPPLPPEQITPSYSSPAGWGGGQENVYNQQVRYGTGPQPNMTGYITRRKFEHAQEDLRRKMAARMIVVALLSWYLGHRPVKPLRAQVDKLQDTSKQQAEQLDRFTYQQQEAQARIAEQNRQLEQFTRPQSIPFGPERPPVRPIEAPPVPVVNQQPKLVGENGEEVILQPGQRLERAGAYSVIVDEHNRIVQRVMPHGEEYKRDLSHEQIPTLLGARGPRFMSTGLSGSGSGGQPMAGSSSSPILPTVQLPADHSLPTAVDPSRSLPETKQNSVVAALTSPWLWLGVGVLLIAFFAAATI